MKESKKPTLYIGDQPFYIHTIWVDSLTGEVTEERNQKDLSDKTISESRMDDFARALGFFREA